MDGGIFVVTVTIDEQINVRWMVRCETALAGGNQRGNGACNGAFLRKATLYVPF